MNQKTTSKKPDALQKLRQIIREEVKNAIRDEMVPILLEVIKGTAKPLVEVSTPASRALKNLIPANSAPITTSPNPVSSILEETRKQMLASSGIPADDEYRTLMSATTNDMAMFSPQPPSTIEEETSMQVNSMLASAGRASKEEYVEINQVPDFSAVMKKMNL